MRFRLTKPEKILVWDIRAATAELELGEVHGEGCGQTVWANLELLGNVSLIQ